MAVYQSETPDGDLRIVKRGEDVRCPVTAEGVVTVPESTPDWFARIAREQGYDVVEATEDAATPAEVASD